MRPPPLSLEGTDADIVRFLLHRGLVTYEQFDEVVRDDDGFGQGGASPQLCALFIKKGYITRKALDALREESKVLGRCDDCLGEYTIYYYNEDAGYPCMLCHAPVRPVNGAELPKPEHPDLSMLVRTQGNETVLDIAHATAPPPSGKEATLVSQNDGGSAILDMNAAASATNQADAFPTAPVADTGDPTFIIAGEDGAAVLDLNAAAVPRLHDEQEVVVPVHDRGAILPDMSVKAPAAVDETIVVQDESGATALDMNFKRPAAVDETIVVQDEGGATLLDMNFKAPADVDETVIVQDEGGATLLDMNVKAPAAEEEIFVDLDEQGATVLDARPKAPADADETVVVHDEPDATLLDMVTSGKLKAPAETVEPDKTADWTIKVSHEGTVDETVIVSDDATLLDMHATKGLHGGAGTKEESDALLPDSEGPRPNLSEETLLVKDDYEATLLDMSGSQTSKTIVGDDAKDASRKKDAPDSPTDTGTTIVVGADSPSATEGTLMVGEESATDKGPATLPGMTPGSITPTRSTPSKTTSFGGTPKTMGGVRLTVPKKSAPKEVEAAAKDAKRIFGKYILVKELGRGGAGVVYKAWDTLLQQYVALKFIRDQDMSGEGTSSGSQAIEDFQREARMSARLRHPNIARIYELGSMSNRYYLSMEYVEGCSLFELIHGGRERNIDTGYVNETEKYINIIRNVSMAVDHAHKQNPPVVHRDLKPHNVLVDMSGQPFVVDFGLAKEVDVSQNVTMTGVVKGTPSYMAPEQAEGKSKDIDIRTDVYSLGAVLYEMVTGRPPFYGDNVREVLNRIVNEIPVRPNEIITKSLLEKPDGPNRPKIVPKPLETIIMKALEKRKADRYPTAKDFADDIERFQKAEDILAREPGVWKQTMRKLRAHPVLTGTAAIILLVASTVAIVVNAIPKPEPGMSIAEVEGRAKTDFDNKDWTALRNSVRDLRRAAPSHPRIPDYEDGIAKYDEDLRKCRADWQAGLARMRSEQIRIVVDALRPIFGRFKELQPEFRESLRNELQPWPINLVRETQKIHGEGASPVWVAEIVKQNAKTTLDQIVTLQELEKDATLPFLSGADLVESQKKLERVIAYLGTWELRVNVVPFAEVTLLRDKKEIPDIRPEFTPLGLLGLEVGEAAYQVEICWPSRANPTVKFVQEIRDLKHGQTVIISGDITKSAMKVDRR